MHDRCQKSVCINILKYLNVHISKAKEKKWNRKHQISSDALNTKFNKYHFAYCENVEKSKRIIKSIEKKGI